MSAGHLIVSCAGMSFALAIEGVIEVLQMVAPMSRLPRAPRYCIGAVNYHGRLVPLLDLGARLGLCSPRTVNELVDGRIVLCEDRDGLLGYAVDDVSELTDRQPTAIANDSHRFGGLVTGAVHWQDHGTALVLDLRPGVVLPLVAGERLRRLVADMEAASRRSTASVAPPPASPSTSSGGRS